MISRAIAAQFFGYRVVGAAEAARYAGRLPERLTDEVERKMKNLVAKIASRAATYTIGTRATNPKDLLGRISGNLADALSKGFKVRRTGHDVEGIVGPGRRVKYAAIQEFGGDIYPVYKPMLAWEDPETGEWRFAHHVYVPPRPTLGRALKDFRPIIAEELGKAYKAAVVLTRE